MLVLVHFVKMPEFQGHNAAGGWGGMRGGLCSVLSYLGLSNLAEGECKLRSSRGDKLDFRRGTAAGAVRLKHARPVYRPTRFVIHKSHIRLLFAINNCAVAWNVRPREGRGLQ